MTRSIKTHEFLVMNKLGEVFGYDEFFGVGLRSPTLSGIKAMTRFQAYRALKQMNSEDKAFIVYVCPFKTQ